MISPRFFCRCFGWTKQEAVERELSNRAAGMESIHPRPCLLENVETGVCSKMLRSVCRASLSDAISLPPLVRVPAALHVL